MLLKSFVLLLLILSIQSFYQNAFAQKAAPSPIRVAGYVAIVHPLVTFSSDAPVYNFSKSYTVGLPIGINFWKSPKIAFSLEIVPFIKSDSIGSRTSNILIHPGVLAVLGKGFAFAGRLAFETSGRYGFTPVISKIIKKNNNSNFFVALPMPFRFGNNKPVTFAPGFELGFGF